MMELEESRIAFVGFCIGLRAGLSYAKEGMVVFNIGEVAAAANYGLVCSDLEFIKVEREEVEYVARLLEPLLTKAKETT